MSTSGEFSSTECKASEEESSELSQRLVQASSESSDPSQRSEHPSEDTVLNIPEDEHTKSDEPSSETCSRAFGGYLNSTIQNFFSNRLITGIYNNYNNNNHSGQPKSNQSGQIELRWRNLCYEVAQFRWQNLVKGKGHRGFTYRRLLDSISGSVRSGELVAIMGPSGAGKTTLIECISGRRKIGVSGEIVVSGGNKRTKLAYNAQDDSLMPCLTVFETLLFASKLRNYQRNNRLKVKLVDDNENVYNATTYPDSDLIIR